MVWKQISRNGRLLRKPWSRYKYDPRKILNAISDNFPKNRTFDNLRDIMRKHINHENTDVPIAMRDLYSYIKYHCNSEPLKDVYDFGDDKRLKFNNDAKIQGIKKNNFKKNKKNFKNNKRNKAKQMKEKLEEEIEEKARHISMKRNRFPKHWVFCGANHPPFNCEKRIDNACWWCGILGHKSSVCKIREEEEERKISTTFAKNVSRRTLVIFISKEEDLLTRISAIERNKMCNGIVLDTGAQASVTDCVKNLHSYFPLSDNNQNNIASVTNTPIKVLGSIDGIPYLCWKDEKIKLIRGDNLIYIPPSLFVMEKVSVAGIHEALGHIDTNVAEKSVKEGFIQVDESD